MYYYRYSLITLKLNSCLEALSNFIHLRKFKAKFSVFQISVIFKRVPI